VFFVSVAQFVVTPFVGYGMDTLGRKRMWMICLAAAALFTGLTFFFQTFWQLVIIRMLASAFAQSELAVTITRRAVRFANRAVSFQQSAGSSLFWLKADG
jgi:MFS family permease